MSGPDRAAELAHTIPTSPYDALRKPPRVRVEVVRELSRSGAGFLQLREAELQNHHEDGRVSAPYRYFLVERPLLDAVAIVLFRRRAAGVEVVLRSQLRPPLSFRHAYAVPLAAEGTGAVQWEIPAGLVEPGEAGPAGLFERASAETAEEVGIALPPARFAQLGEPSSLSPGLIAEKLFFVFAEVRDDDRRCTATGDGHPVEEGSRSLFVSLADALRAIDDGLVHDVKTEIGLRRLRAHVLGDEAARERSEAAG